MKKLFLKEFARTGAFGTIGLGSLKKDVVALLGPKYDFHDGGETQIIKYGWYEFFYHTATEKIFGIQNDHLLANCVNHQSMIALKTRKAQLDTWFLKAQQDTRFKEVKEMLDKENIPYSIEPLYKSAPDNIIKCASGVFFDFCSESWTPRWSNTGKHTGWTEIKEQEEENFVLNGIRLFESSRF